MCAEARPWSTEELRRLRDMRLAGASVRDASLALGRTENAVRNQLRRLGVRVSRAGAPAGRVRVAGLTADEMRVVRRLRAQGATIREVCRAVHHRTEIVSPACHLADEEIRAQRVAEEAERRACHAMRSPLSPELRMVVIGYGREMRAAIGRMRCLGRDDRTIDRVIAMRYGLTEGEASMVRYVVEEDT